MPRDPRNRTPTEDPPYSIYGRSGRSGGGGKPDPASEEGLRRLEGRSSGRQGARDYKVYRAAPKGLRARLRGEEGLDGAGGGRGRIPRGDRLRPGSGQPWWRRQLRPGRLLLWLVGAIVAWVALSAVLFVVSAQQQSGSIPASVQATLTPGSNLLTGTDTVLVIGTDQRPAGSKEPGAFAGGIRSDTIMLWRIGGGTSRRLSIPRDTVVNIPGYGMSKINAAYSYGGPALAVKTIEKLTGVQINHLIIVNLANFPKFIDDIGGVTVRTGRICSVISGGIKNGGFQLYLKPGVHHLDGRDALTLARTRENRCNAASNDLTREGYQQQILNGIKAQLLTPTTFFHLPWAAWDAPQAVRSDMGGFTLLQLFAAAEMGGSAPVRILGVNHLPLPDVYSPSGQAAVRQAVDKLMNG